MYSEAALLSLPAIFHDMFFNLSISTDKLETRLHGFQRLHFSFFSCLDPCVPALKISANQRSNIGRNFAMICKKSVLAIITIGPILYVIKTLKACLLF